MAIALTCGWAKAQTYSLAGGWNSTTDSASATPSNLWAYGTFSTGSLFVVPSSAANSTSNGVNYWEFPPSADPGTADPNIENNLSSSIVNSPSGVEFLPGTVSFGPYRGPAVAQFTAPSAGLYSISATFQTDQIRAGSTSDGTTANVYVDGLSKYAQQLTDPGSAQFGTAETYTASNVALLKGDTVDFAVGGGYFTTEVTASLTAPEPSTWILLIAGLGATAIVARRHTACAA